MPAFPRPLLLVSHAAALAVGCWFAWPGGERPVSVAEASAQETFSGHRTAPARPRPSSEVSDAPVSPRDFAVAWEILRRRPLPREERHVLLMRLLEKWSVVDLEAALRASLLEFPYNSVSPSGDGIDLCYHGILANPDLALQLIRDRALGLDTLSLLQRWVFLMLNHEPERVLSAFAEMTGDDRSYTLVCLADSLHDSEVDPFAEPSNFPAREALLARVLSLTDETDRQHEIRRAAARVSGSFTPSQLQQRMESATDPVLRSLYFSAFAQSLSTDDPFADVDFSEIWGPLPVTLRSEVSAEALYGENCDVKLILPFAKQALVDGNLDALKAAAGNDNFGRMADNTEQPAELADWALTLPEDPRTLELYERSMAGAAVQGFSTVRGKILALPPGWQRDHGLAALAYGGHYSDQPAAEIEQLLQQIRNPDVKARAMAEYRANQASDDE